MEPIEAAGLLLGSGLMALGILVHFALVMSDLEDKGQHYSPFGYLRLHPWRAFSMVLCSWVCIWMAHKMGELTSLAAFLIGFSCQTAADRLRAEANKRANK